MATESKVTVASTIALARAEVGYTGKKSNKDLDDPTANTVGKYTKYARDVGEAGFYNGSKQNQPWCCVFFDWLILKQSGSLAGTEKYKPVSIYGAGVGWAYKAYKSAGMTATDPQPGDQVFYYSGKEGDFTHTGLVVSVEADTIHTIEGNWNNRVTERELLKTDKRIYGYGRPKYDAEEPEEIKTGDIVRLREGAHCYTANGMDRGYGFSGWVYDSDLLVGEINESAGVAHISTDMTLETYTGWASLNDLTKVAPDDNPDDNDEDDDTDEFVTINFPCFTPEDDPPAEAVLTLQALLDSLGFSGNGCRVPFTGFYDDDTIYAVNAYKKHVGFEPNGIVDADTWTRLFSHFGMDICN